MSTSRNLCDKGGGLNFDLSPVTHLIATDELLVDRVQTHETDAFAVKRPRLNVAKNSGHRSADQQHSDHTEKNFEKIEDN